MVEAHGGAVSVESPGIGQGCTFIITLPLCAYAQQPQVQGEVLPSEGRLKGVRILLVDDSVDVLEVMEQLLLMEDADVDAYSGPKLALQSAADARYDVIISDIGMPGMDGHALIRALRGLEHLRYIPAIALTGYGASADQYKSRQSGFDRHLNKPVGYDDLIEAIERLNGSASV